MKWNIHFLSDRVEAQALAFPPGILANFLHILELIEDFGPALGLPHTSAMGRGLFEIRAKGKEGIGRVFFCLEKDRKIVLLHAFVKKSQRTPKMDLAIARKRQKEYGK